MMCTRRAVALRERGATAVEYALIVGFIAAVIVAAAQVFGMRVSTLFEVPGF